MSEPVVESTDAGQKQDQPPASPAPALWTAPPGARLLYICVGALVLVVAIAIGSNRYIATHRNLYVLNAFDQAITVQVPGAGNVELAPSQIAVLAVAEGRHQARVTGAVDAEIEFGICTGFLDRWTQSPAFILNPGGRAVLLFETAGAKDSPGKEPPFRLLYGNQFESFLDVDYRFEPFPEVVSPSSQTSRTRIDWLNAPTSVICHNLNRIGETGQALALAEWYLQHGSTDRSLLDAYVAVARTGARQAQAIAYLGTSFARRPVVIEWHRAYQELAIESGQVDAVVREYDGAVTAEPESAALLYLRGRMCGSLKQALSYFSRAAIADPKFAYAQYALAFSLASGGDWAAALAPAQTACELAPEDAAFEQVWFDAALAGGDCTGPAKYLEEQLQRDACNMGAAASLCYLLAGQGKDQEVEQVRAAFAQEATKRYSQQGQVLADELRSHALYAVGDFVALSEANQKESALSGRRWPMIAATETGRFADAVQQMPASEDSTGDPFDMLLVSVALQRNGDADTARTLRQRAHAILAKGNLAFAALAQLLQREDPATLEETLDLSLHPVSKAIALLALAPTDAAQRGPWQDAIGRLNVGRRYPYHLLKRLLAPNG